MHHLSVVLSQLSNVDKVITHFTDKKTKAGEVKLLAFISK